jgi:hypothetical protein
MALKLALAETPIGLSIPSAYARITEVFAQKEETVVIVAVHGSAEARQRLALEIETRKHVLPTAEIAGALWPALYAAIKALPEYAGAEDC